MPPETSPISAVYPQSSCSEVDKGPAMSEWYYQLLGEEFGPVSASTLVELLREGTLSPGDPVRTIDSDLWITADQVQTRNEQSAVLQDLSELSFEFEETSSEPFSRFRQSASESSLAVNPDRESAKSADDASGDMYYYQLRGQSHGPVVRETLIRMAEQGKLTDTDLIRTGAEVLWQAASEYRELSAAFLLRKAESQGKNRVIPATRPAASETPTSTLKSKPEDPASAAVTNDQRPDLPTVTSEESSSRKPHKPVKPRGTEKRRRPRATPSTPELDEDVFQEVFSEESVGPAKSVAALPQARQLRDQDSEPELVPVSGVSDRPDLSSVLKTPAPVPALESPGVGIRGGNSSRSIPMPTRPPVSRKPAAGRPRFEFDFEFSTPVKVLSAMLVLATFWFGYGPLKRYLTISESHYISRVEEAIKTFESLEPTMDREKYSQAVQTVTRELEAYIATMKEVGATGKTSLACAGAMNRVVEFGRLDPANEKLRSKLLKEARQLISTWKGT